MTSNNRPYVGIGSYRLPICLEPIIQGVIDVSVFHNTLLPIVLHTYYTIRSFQDHWWCVSDQYTIYVFYFLYSPYHHHPTKHIPHHTYEYGTTINSVVHQWNATTQQHSFFLPAERR